MGVPLFVLCEIAGSTIVSNGTESDIKTLRAEMAQLRDDLAKISDTMQGAIRHGGAEAMQKAQHSAHQAQEKAKRATQSVVEEIEERPVTAALAAFSAGLVLGMLFSARRG